MLNRINILLLSICMAIVNIAYFPSILNTSRYNICMAILGVCVVACLLLNIKLFIGKFFKCYLYVAVAFLLLSAVAILACDNDTFFHASFNIYLSITCFAVGYTSKVYTLKVVKVFFVIFILSALMLGLYSVFRNVGGFKILDNYAILLKNSSGVFLATAALLSLILYLLLPTSKFRFFLIPIFILLVSSLLVFRARSSILGLFLCIGFILMKFSSSKQLPLKMRVYFVLGCTIIILLIITGSISIDFIYDALFRNKDVTDVDDLSSGRTIMFSKAWEIYNNYPLFGNLEANQQLRSVDNFLINILGRYGNIGLLVFFPIYIFVWYVSIKGILKNKVEDAYAYYALLIILTVSLFEAPFPFGPGTPVICAYVLWGISQRRQEECVAGEEYDKTLL